jgi:dipeptidyl aminopeptidase/acylaminoacyl peptidase
MGCRILAKVHGTHFMRIEERASDATDSLVRRYRPGVPCRLFVCEQDAAGRYTIASRAFPPSDTDIFVAAGDGTSVRPLATDPALDYNASFSPDGRWIVFTSHRGGSADINRIRPDGSDLERLTDDPAFDDQAAISPDGKSVAFVSTRRGRADIWTLDLIVGFQKEGP